MARGQSNQDQLETLLASRDGVKIATDSPGDLRPHSELRFIAIGQNTTPVIVTGMRANVVRREQPLSETLVFGPPQGEGSNIQVGFNLDSHNPIACSLDDEMFLDGPYFSSNHVSVNLDEHVVFTIRVFTDEYYAEWEILVEALVDGKSKTFSVRDGDRPFRTTAFADSYNKIFDFDFTAGRFIRLPPGYRFSDLAK